MNMDFLDDHDSSHRMRSQLVNMLGHSQKFEPLQNVEHSQKKRAPDLLSLFDLLMSLELWTFSTFCTLIIPSDFCTVLFALSGALYVIVHYSNFLRFHRIYSHLNLRFHSFWVE